MLMTTLPVKKKAVTDRTERHENYFKRKHAAEFGTMQRSVADITQCAFPSWQSSL